MADQFQLKEEQNRQGASQDRVNHDDIQNLSREAVKNSALKTPIDTTRTRKSSSAFRTISEVADELGVQQHVLRFWETKFSHVKPLKRGGGRRYYRPEDVKLLKAIHRLLYIEGYTIKGVQKLFREAGKNVIVENFGETLDVQISIKTDAVQAVKNEEKAQKSKLSPEQKAALQDVLDELKELRGMIKKS